MSTDYNNSSGQGEGQMGSGLLALLFGEWETHDWVITFSNMSILLLMIISGMAFWWSRGLCIRFLYGFIIASAMIFIPFLTFKSTQGDTKKYLIYIQVVIKMLAVIYVMYKSITGC